METYYILLYIKYNTGHPCVPPDITKIDYIVNENDYLLNILKSPAGGDKTPRKKGETAILSRELTQ